MYVYIMFMARNPMWLAHATRMCGRLNIEKMFSVLSLAS